MEKEIRCLNIEYHSCDNGRKIEGRAIPFNIQSPCREGFREMISPSAVEGVIEQSDIFMLYNHNRDKGFLARNNKGKGSLKIDCREDGVYFSFDCPTDNLGEYIWQRMQKEELDEMSWAFTVDEDVWTKGADGIYDRTITKFGGLYDFSIVDQSYYGISDAVKCARFAEIQEEERLENERLMKEAEERAKAEAEAEEQRKAEAIAEYYRNLKEENKAYLEEK